MSRPLTGGRGELPITFAVQQESEAVLGVLLNRGASFDAVNPATGQREIAIHVAAERGSPRMMRALIAAGADANFASDAGDRPMHVVCRKVGRFYPP